MDTNEGTQLPAKVAANILFAHDRTCCVCRVRGKPVQIHHVNSNPSDHRPENLAVLCFDCHRDTQIRGGFDRKLDAEQVLLYRDDWCRIVASQRTSLTRTAHGHEEEHPNESKQLAAIAEIYRRNGEYELLAMFYNAFGNQELRDKYIELALLKDSSDGNIAFLRHLQGRPDLIPPDVVDRTLALYKKHRDWSQRGRFFRDLGRTAEAAADYARTIFESLDKEGNTFSAAYYLKELAETGLGRDLFILALKEARARNDLWWEIRALEELEWWDELDRVVLDRAAEVEASGNLLLQKYLAEARGEVERSHEIRKEIARGERMIRGK